MRTDQMVWALKIVEQSLERDIAREWALRVRLSSRSLPQTKAMRDEYEALVDRRNALTVEHESPEEMLEKVRNLRKQFEGAVPIDGLIEHGVAAFRVDFRIPLNFLGSR